MAFLWPMSLDIKHLYFLNIVGMLPEAMLLLKICFVIVLYIDGAVRIPLAASLRTLFFNRIS